MQAFSLEDAHLAGLTLENIFAFELVLALKLQILNFCLSL
jgi:hypothetical protein